MNAMLTKIGKDIEKAAELLFNNEVVAIPTETVYGLAGNAYHEGSVKDIFRIKERPTTNPLILHVKDIDQLKVNTLEVPELVYKLADRFCPGPLTFLLPHSPSISRTVTAGSLEVAIRMPDHKMAHQLLRLLDFPLVAPSANKYRGVSPTSARHVLNQLNGKIPYILDGGRSAAGLESTIVRVLTDEITVLRLGAITIEELKNFSSKVHLNISDGETFPGSHRMHYSPRTPLLLATDLDETIKHLSGQKVAVLTFNRRSSYIHEESTVVIDLSEKGDLREAAQNLYQAFYLADELDVDVIIAEKFPDTGLGRTLNDRLERAACAVR
jgi:L-threonylcarbamoyladenylate synthase